MAKEWVDIVVVERYFILRVVAHCEGEINGTDLFLPQLDEQDRRRVNHTFEHSDDHDDQEYGENAYFKGCRLLCHLRIQVLHYGTASTTATSTSIIVVKFAQHLTLLVLSQAFMKLVFPFFYTLIAEIIIIIYKIRAVRDWLQALDHRVVVIDVIHAYFAGVFHSSFEVFM